MAEPLIDIIPCSDWFILILILTLGNNFICHANGRAFFVFGDSLVDSGNNNYLATIARADAPPYGIDYPTHLPTGRFSNGLNIPDIISEHMGWEATLPYLSPELKGKSLVVGANFASAGVGILNDTGIQFVNIIRIPEQLDNFKEYQRRVSAVIGHVESKKLVKHGLVFITLGGNDFVNNYYLVPNSLRSQQFTLQQYVPFLITEYKKVLQRLYRLGGRRIIVTGTGPIGCAPAELAFYSKNGECAEELQLAASLFNPQLVHMIDQLNSEVGHIAFIAANTNQMHVDLFSNPRAFGFTTSKTACCGQGPYNGIGFCTAVSNLCPNRSEYVFWDPFHPSEKANRLIVQQILTGIGTYMHPINLNTIMALDSREY